MAWRAVALVVGVVVVGTGMQVVRVRVRAGVVEAGTKAEVDVARRAAITVAAAEFVEDTIVCLGYEDIDITIVKSSEREK